MAGLFSSLSMASRSLEAQRAGASFEPACTPIDLAGLAVSADMAGVTLAGGLLKLAELRLDLNRPGDAIAALGGHGDAAKDVAAADHHRDLHAVADHLGDLAGHQRHHIRVQTDRAAAEHLTAEFEQYPAIAGTRCGLRAVGGDFSHQTPRTVRAGTDRRRRSADHPAKRRAGRERGARASQPPCGTT